jgi:hypothetical protein
MEKESFLNFINANEVFKLNRKRDIFNFNNGNEVFYYKLEKCIFQSVLF